MTFEVILHLLKNLRLHNVDILEKFKRFGVKQKIYYRKRWFLKFYYELMWPLLTSEVILYFIQMYVFCCVSIPINFHKNCFINECAKKKKAQSFTVSEFFGRYRRTCVLNNWVKLTTAFYITNETINISASKMKTILNP